MTLAELEPLKNRERVDLHGKVALVTGSTRNIGAEIAKALAKEGANVVIHGREKTRRAERKVRPAIEKFGVECEVIMADLTDGIALAGLFEQIKARFGKLDILVLNAAGGLEEWADDDYAMRINRDAQIDCVKHALPLMLEGGRIVYISSNVAHDYQEGQELLFPEYERVARTKKAAENDLLAMGEVLNAKGISLGIVSGPLIEGTPAWLYLKHTGELEDVIAKVEYAKQEDMANAVMEFVTNPNPQMGEVIFTTCSGFGKILPKT